jgi:ribonuclease Z
MVPEPPHRLGALALRVDSVGGLETSVDLPDWRVCLDIGRCPPHLLARDTVLFTHAHMDHLGGVAYHCATRSLLRMPRPTYVVPRAAMEPLARLFAAWRELDQSQLPHGLLPLGPGDTHALRPDLWVRPFATQHTVPSQGYAFFSRRKRLKPQFQGLPESKLRELARGGERELSEPYETLELAVTGDTLPDLIAAEAWVRQAKVLLIECTFLDARVSVEKARSTGHTHLFDLLPYLERLENEVIGLYHFSARYGPGEIERLLDRHLPPVQRARIRALLPPRAGAGLTELPVLPDLATGEGPGEQQRL